MTLKTRDRRVADESGQEQRKDYIVLRAAYSGYKNSVERGACCGQISFEFLVLSFDLGGISKCFSTTKLAKSTKPLLLTIFYRLLPIVIDLSSWFSVPFVVQTETVLIRVNPCLIRLIPNLPSVCSVSSVADSYSVQRTAFCVFSLLSFFVAKRSIFRRPIRQSLP